MRYHGYQFHALKQSFTSIPFRPQTLLSTRRSPARHTAYWYRAHTSKTRLPLLYIHGIGILHTYLLFFSELAAALDTDCSDGQVGIIILDIMPISFRFTHSSLSPEEFIAEVGSIISAHGWDKFVLIGNSFGTALSLQLLKSPALSDKIADILMVDPVVFLLHCPEMVHNFLRRSPVKASEWQLWYFASADIGASHTLARRFLWSENILWREDITRNESSLTWKVNGQGKKRRQWTIVLSHGDIIVDAFAVGSYLTRRTGTKALEDDRDVAALRRDVDGFASASKSLTKKKTWDYDESDKSSDNQGDNLRVLWFDEVNHAEVFDYKHTRKDVIDIVLDYCRAQ